MCIVCSFTLLRASRALVYYSSRSERESHTSYV
jgi:hypothetical protein